MYANNAELPVAVRMSLPSHAQDLFRDAYNRAFDHYQREAVAHRIAWDAVKRDYSHRAAHLWVRRTRPRLRRCAASFWASLHRHDRAIDEGAIFDDPRTLR